LQIANKLQHVGCSIAISFPHLSHRTLNVIRVYGLKLRVRLRYGWRDGSAHLLWMAIRVSASAGWQLN
jgi:hypothetical protein